MFVEDLCYTLLTNAVSKELQNTRKEETTNSISNNTINLHLNIVLPKRENKNKVIPISFK